MANPVRYPQGISTATKGTSLSSLPAADPTKIHQFFTDFTEYVAGDWTITRIGTTPTETLSDEAFGTLLLTVSAADNDGDQLQKKGETFLPASGKKMWFKSRFKVSDATQSDFLIGLAVTDTTLLGAVDGDGVTDGMFFSKEDGDALLDFHCQKNTTTGQIDSSSLATVVSDTYMTVGFYYDGNRYITLFVDEVQKGTVDLTTTNTTYLPDTEMCVSFAILNGEAVAKTMSIDYIYAAIER